MVERAPPSPRSWLWLALLAVALLLLVWLLLGDAWTRVFPSSGDVAGTTTCGVERGHLRHLRNVTV